MQLGWERGKAARVQPLGCSLNSSAPQLCSLSGFDYNATSAIPIDIFLLIKNNKRHCCLRGVVPSAVDATRA